MSTLPVRVVRTAGLAALVYGAMQSADHGWTSGPVAGPVAGGLLLLVVFAVVEARFATRPIMPLRLFRIRQVAVGSCHGIGAADRRRDLVPAV